jgi:hypothetical protein
VDYVTVNGHRSCLLWMDYLPLGSAALATRVVCGPAVPSGTEPVCPVVECVVPVAPVAPVVCVVEWSLLRWRAFLTLSIVDILNEFGI